MMFSAIVRNSLKGRMIAGATLQKGIQNCHYSGKNKHALQQMHYEVSERNLSRIFESCWSNLNGKRNFLEQKLCPDQTGRFTGLSLFSTSAICQFRHTLFVSPQTDLTKPERSDSADDLCLSFHTQTSFHHPARTYPAIKRRSGTLNFLPSGPLPGELSNFAFSALHHHRRKHQI